MSKRTDLYKYMKERGLTDLQVAALMGNVHVETGGSYDHLQKQLGRSDPAHGLFQFDPRGSGLLKLYKDYLLDKELSDSMESQVDFVVDILNLEYPHGVDYLGRGNVKKIREAFDKGNLEQATKAFQDYFLRPGKPHEERRIKAAKDLCNAFVTFEWQMECQQRA